MMHNRLVVPALALVVGALCGATGWSLYQHRGCGRHAYVDRDLSCGRRPVIEQTGYAALAHELRDFIGQREATGGASSVSVYFRDLRNGPVMGIDENAAFVPASLLKLPIAMAYFDLEEEAPGVLGTELLYSRANVNYHIPQQIEVPATDLREGSTYTVEALLRNSLVHSDNLAYYLLLGHMNGFVPEGTRRILRTFEELGVIDPRDLADEVISVRRYSSLFRILYTASYLTVDDSEKVLSWLAQSSFDKGLAAGVPEHVPVANKFGERVIDNVHQLHDCGIVYYPGNPYTLCVMTKGRDWQSLRETIGAISRMVYREVESRQL